MNKEATKETAATAAKAAVEASGIPTRVVLRVIVILLAVLIVLWMVSKLTGIILLLILSIFFAYLVSPLVEFLRQPRTFMGRTIVIPKLAAIGLAYLVILAAVMLAIFVIVPRLSTQFPEFAAQAKAYWQSLGERSQQFIEYSRSRRIPAPIVDAVNNAIPKVQEKVFATATSAA